MQALKVRTKRKPKTKNAKPYRAKGKVAHAYGIHLVRGGEDYFAQQEKLIAKAEHEIHLQTYIFEGDKTGERVADALIKAANRGIEIYIVLDAYGSRLLGKELKAKMEKAGINLRFFGSVYTGQKWAWGRRLHHKILVVDRCHALVGGINISNNYSGMGGEPAWLDFALQVDGPVCKDIFRVCRQIYSQWYSLKGRRFKTFDKNQHPDQDIPMQLRLNDWLRGRNQIAQSYIQAMRQAKHEIIIANSYFLPGTYFRQVLRKAAQRGVKVKIMMPAISDIPLINNAMRYLYDFLMRYDIEIYEWKPSVLHAKVAVADGRWCTVGSYNLNYLSAYGSIEFNINVLDVKFCSMFQEQLNELLGSDCKRIMPEDYLKKISLLKRLGNWLSYRILKLSSALLITFPGQRIFNRNRYA